MPKRITDEDKLIGRNLREIRMMRNVSLDAVGACLGVRPQQVWKYEVGLDRISAGQLLRATRFLDVPIAMIFEENPAVKLYAHKLYAQDAEKSHL